MKIKNNLRNRLFIWYGGSLFLIAIFFWFGVHILAIPYGTEIFIGLLLLLSLIGFFIIQKITNSLSKLTKSIEKISSKNLSERIEPQKEKDEIGLLAKSFNELLDRLEDSFKRERQFIGDVAHELKTPIATMRSSIEVALSKDRTKSEYKEILKDSLEDVNSMTSTLTDVLDLAWIEAHKDKKFLKKVDLSSLAYELVEIGTKLAESNKVEIIEKIEPGIFIYGEKEKLARALLNIIDNAIKYNKKGGLVQISLYKKDGLVYLNIKDSGVGIPHDEIHKIFNRFYRGINTSKVTGTGLGLSIAKSIITMHRGKIIVKSEKNKGTKFEIILPTS